ncbi:MAG: type II toxin-antitoxin system HicB family antitoxin [archaeon]
MHTLSAIIVKEDEMYIAKCPEIGTVSQGNSIDEALKNLKEATEIYLEEFPIKEAPIKDYSKPLLTTFEVA